MDSRRSSRLRLFSKREEPIKTPLEWETAWIAVDGRPEDMNELSVSLQGSDLKLQYRQLMGEFRILAEWPRSGPGHYRLALESPSATEEIPITVNPLKITDDAFEVLLDDLESLLPASVAIGLRSTGALGGLELRERTKETVSQEFERLEKTLYGCGGRCGLLGILKDITGEPYSVLKTESVWVPRRRARRIHPTSLRTALAAAGNIDEDGSVLRVVDRFVEKTVDVYENRLVKLFVAQVRIRLGRLLQAAKKWKSESLEFRSQGYIRDLELARSQASFLEQVQSVDFLPLNPTMVLMRRPPYRAALEAYIDFQRGPWLTVRLDAPALDAPLDNLPHLYETWGTLQVLSALVDVASQLGYRCESEHVTRRSRHDLWVRILPDGRPAAIFVHPDTLTKVKFIPQRGYGRGGAIRSVSFRQIPDIAVEVHPKDDQPRLFLFDPKYKLESTPDGEISDDPKKDDIDKMHAYRDAIRDEEGQRVVEFAAILYPGDNYTYGRGLEALKAVPGDDSLLRRSLSAVMVRALS